MSDYQFKLDENVHCHFTRFSFVHDQSRSDHSWIICQAISVVESIYCLDIYEPDQSDFIAAEKSEQRLFVGVSIGEELHFMSLNQHSDDFNSNSNYFIWFLN